MSPFPQIGQSLHLAVSGTLQLRSKHGKARRLGACACQGAMGDRRKQQAASFVGNIMKSLECKVTGKLWIWFSFLKD